MRTIDIKTLMLSGLMVTGVASCSLDYEPLSTPTELTEGTQTDTTTAVLKDKAAAESQLTSLVKLLHDRQEHCNLDYRLLGDSHCDNAYAGQTGAEVLPYENNTIDASNSVLSRDWTRYLADIAQANVLINGSEQLYDQGKLTESEYRAYKAQGEIFRALMMFRMARIWGSFPVITSVAKTITSDNVEEVFPTYYPPRSTTEECYDQILKDLLDAEQYAPEINNNDRTQLSKTVAQAMLAKVYAEKPRQDYAKVIEYAEKVRATTGVALEEDFSTLWTYDTATGDIVKRNTSEGILEVQYVSGAGNWETWMYGRQLDNYEFYFTWAKWITPSRDLISAFEKEGDTKRYNETVVWYDCKWAIYYPSSNYAFMYKCRSGYSNVYWIRLADIILLEAEAYAYQGNNSKAAELVNMIRNRAGLKNLTSDKTSSKEAMIKAVLDERRLELALEGERWFDLCRNNMVEETLNNLCSRDSGRHALEKQYDSNSYYLPLPQTALDENNNLEQNPGY